MRVEAEIRLSYQYNALTTMGMTGVIMLRYNYAVAQYNLIVVKNEPARGRARGARMVP